MAQKEIMLTFEQYAEKKNIPLPKIDENQRRAGIAHWAYPSGYARHQYPDGYFMPTAADARQKMDKQPKDKA